VTVEKAGRKWATLSNGHRIDLESLMGESTGYGVGSAGRCYVAKSDHDEECERDQLWSGLQKKINETSRRKSVTAGQVRRAAEVLGIELTN
jgi:hypothetical protein